jgi:hypothetical protein
MNFRDQQEEVNSLKGNISIREISELKEQMQIQYEEQLKRVTEMVLLDSLVFTGFPCSIVCRI